MSKAYDKLSWSFLTSVLRKMGFAEAFIEMVYRLLSNNWYSVIINGVRYGFFKSSRGLKQGDPLSPALFVIAAETFSRALNYLHFNDKFIGFSMHKRGPQINHLSYADDLVLLTSGDKYSIKLIMKLLYKYQLASGQEVNRDKSFFLTHHKTDNLFNRRIKRWTGFTQSSFPFNYLGCPIYTGAKKICYFSDISKKILNKIAGWQGRLLSSGGKAVIIKHILQSQTLHIFASLMPPSTVIKEIEMQFANFFWGQRDGKNSYHWASWKNMCFPTKEGGLGFKSLIDICHTFSAKRWWRLRTEPSLWSLFLKAKYCQRSNPNSKVIATKDSMAWKDLLCTRDKMEQHIIWKINSGNSMFWWDNWTQVKAAIKKKFKFIDYTWNWSKVCLMEENFKAIITSSMIYWNRPNGNNWKLNTDGSYMRNQNKAGAGGIVRNSIGDMIIAFSYPTQCYTNNYSEAQAALIGISWCLGQQFEALEVELDSQVVVRMINGSCKPPWRIHNLIEDIKNKIAQRNIIVKHCYREGNEVADALAKYATNIQEPIIYFQESKLPAEVRGLLRMNKLHLPSFRRRPKKASFWHYNPP
ncbi:hypothetical protein AABB24_003501 [Solanum stoloniferum]|uniref:Uncharacterized protein n=2 Tax=Solanum stoloniferum TaxID=62892 RepID=A0ABD2V8F5_9SOLN